MSSPRYQSFFIRVWFVEPTTTTQPRIFVQPLPNGETHGFVKWQDVVSYLDSHVQLNHDQHLKFTRRNNNE